MNNIEKYTTLELKEAISLSKEIDEKTKDAEKDKTVISNEAYAVIDYLDTLTKKMEKLRMSFMTMR